MGALGKAVVGAAATAAWLSLSAAPWAETAPQALALVSTGGAMDVNCDASECVVELSTFCLQPDRFSPPPGTRYRLVEGGDVRLTGVTREGETVDLDVTRYVSYASARTHLAVTARVARDHLAARGVERLTIEVGDGAALLPDGAGATIEPELLASVLRPLGSEIVDRDGERMVAARLANRLINVLPADRGVSVDQREALWGETVARLGEGRASGAGVELARGAFDLCSYVVDRGGMRTLRGCLERHHDGFLSYLNSRYWKAVKTGS